MQADGPLRRHQAQGILIGFWQVFRGDFLDGLWLAFIGWFLLQAGHTESAQVTRAKVRHEIG
jgi:hypothetical protein